MSRTGSIAKRTEVPDTLKTVQRTSVTSVGASGRDGDILDREVKAIHSRYHIVKKLGEGASAEVFLVEDRSRKGMRLALKQLRRREDAELLRREFEVLSALRHPNLVAAYDLDLRARQPYLTNEFVDGVDISTWSRRREHVEVLGALAGVLRALCLLHDRGWVHGDLKPGNILIARSTTPKLIDLGMAARPGGGNSAGGTPGYVAPEVLTGGEVTERSDIYSVAVLALELLTGARRRAFGDDAAAAVERQLAGRSMLDEAGCKLDEPIAQLLRECIDPEAAARPDTVVSLIRRFEKASGQRLTPDYEELDALPRSRLVGRKHQLAAVRTALDEIGEEHRPVVINVHGTKGMGKTRLLDELEALASRRAFTCIRGRSVFEILEASTAVFRDEPKIHFTQSIEPALAGLIPSANPVAHPSLEGLNIRLRTALFDVVNGAGHRGATAVLFDDFDSMEEAELDALTGVIGALLEQDDETTGLPLMLAVASESRLELPETVRSLLLQPLDADESDELVRSLLPGITVDDDVLSTLRRWGAGSPWLIEESLLSWLRFKGDKTVDDDGLDYLQKVLDIARSRLSLASDDQRQALEMLSLAPELSHEALYELLPKLTPEVLTALIDLRMIQERTSHTGATTLAIAGHHLRTLLVGELGRKQRALHHTAIAAALRATDGPIAQLAFHVEGAGQRVEAAETYLKAAESGFDLRGGLALRAAELGGQEWEGWATAKRRAALSLRAASEADEAAKHFEDLVNCEQATAADRIELAELHGALGRPKRALEALDKLDTLGMADSRGTLVLARTLFALGRHDEALELCERLPRTGNTVNLIGLVYHIRGDLDRAASTLAEADDLYGEEEEDLQGSAKVANNLAIVFQTKGDLTSAQHWYQRALERSRLAGDHLRAVGCQVNHGTVCQQGGEFRQAIDDYERAVFYARRLGSEKLEVQARLNLATLLLELGDIDGAEDHLRRGSSASGRFAIYRQLNLAEVGLGRGDFDRALEHLDAADDLMVSSSDTPAAVEALLARVKVALARGYHTDALSIADRAVGDAARAGLEKLRDEGRLLWAMSNRRRPDPDLDGVREALEEVVHRMERRGERGRLWLANFELSQVEALQGRTLESAFHLSKATQVVDEVLESLPTRYRETLLHRPDFRDVYAATRARSQNSATTQPAEVFGETGLETQSLLRINLELARVRDPAELLVVVLDKAIELTGAQRGLIILIEGERLRIAASRNVDQESLRKGGEHFSKSLAREVLARGQGLLTIDALADQRFNRFESVHALKLRSVVCVPLRVWGSITGVIYLDNRFRHGAFGRHHISLLEGFGAQAGLALDTARLLQQQQKQLKELEGAKQQIETLTEELKETIRQQSIDLAQAEELLEVQRAELSKSSEFSDIVGRSALMQRVLELVSKTRTSEIPVYIYGESGTGKELVAKAIHRMSPRRDAPMVTLNCGALSQQLLASEMFGHKKGAFTGAVRDHPGLLRMAHGGTLFLDEVAEMPPELQVQLLRVLQTGDFRPVGADDEVHADVRVISASNVDLKKAVEDGDFREDLYYRLNVLRIDLPPLRNRKEDIPLLLNHFLGETPISRAALPLLYNYDWPGNVRELTNELARATALCEGTIHPSDLSSKLRKPRSIVGDVPTTEPLVTRVAAFERQVLVDALAEAGYSATVAARNLGISRAGLYKKLARHHIQRTGHGSADDDDGPPIQPDVNNRRQ